MDTQVFLDRLADCFPRPTGSEEEFDAREVILTALADRLDVTVEEEGFFGPLHPLASSLLLMALFLSCLWLYELAPAIFGVAVLILWCMSAWLADGRPFLMPPLFRSRGTTANLVAKRVAENPKRPLVLLIAKNDSANKNKYLKTIYYNKNIMLLSLCLLACPVVFLGVVATPPSDGILTLVTGVGLVGSLLFIAQMTVMGTDESAAKAGSPVVTAVLTARRLWSTCESLCDVRLICTSASTPTNMGSLHYANQHRDEWFDRPLTVIAFEGGAPGEATCAPMVGDLFGRPLLTPAGITVSDQGVAQSATESFRRSTSDLVCIQPAQEDIDVRSVTVAGCLQAYLEMRYAAPGQHI